MATGIQAPCKRMDIANSVKYQMLHVIPQAFHMKQEFGSPQL